MSDGEGDRPNFIQRYLQREELPGSCSKTLPLHRINVASEDAFVDIDYLIDCMVKARAKPRRVATLVKITTGSEGTKPERLTPGEHAELERIWEEAGLPSPFGCTQKDWEQAYLPALLLPQPRISWRIGVGYEESDAAYRRGRQELRDTCVRQLSTLRAFDQHGMPAEGKGPFVRVEDAAKLLPQFGFELRAVGPVEAEGARSPATAAHFDHQEPARGYGQRALCDLMDGSWEGLHKDYVRKEDGLYLPSTSTKTTGFLRFQPGANFETLPVLPFPFSTDEFLRFSEGDQTFADDWIESRYLNDDKSRDEQAISNLKDRSPAAAQLALSYLEARAGRADPSEAPFGGVPAAVKRTLKSRADRLGAVLVQAEALALDPTDWQSGWAQLVLLAQSSERPAPLMGYVEGEGVKYQKDSASEPIGWLTREAYRKRRQRKP